MNRLAPEQISEILKPISEAIAPLVSAVGSQQFLSLIFSALQRIVATDASVLWRYGARINLEFNAETVATFPEDLEIYKTVGYLLDPYYRAAIDQKFRGFAMINDLCPEAFRETEYYEKYYRLTGVIDECGYVLSLPNGEFLNVSLGRSKKMAAFTPVEIAKLEALSPLLQALCEAHWCLPAVQGEGDGHLDMHLTTALTNFGTSKLTARESEIIQLVLLGHSTRSVAERLHIAPGTVKIHRKRSYEKLDISSQSELFHLFLAAMQSFDVYRGGDPLTGYY